MRATIYVIPGSSPSMAGRLMLEHKGIDYRRRDLVAALSRPILRLVGFDGITVPAIKLDGERLQGTTTISRALDALVPQPPLFPADPERREAVERAEAWGDEVLQPVPRRLTWAALSRVRSGVRSFLEGARLGMPAGLAARTSAPVVALSKRLTRATDEAVRADLAALPGMLGHVDELIGKGVIGGAARNAADYQIATSIRLLLALDDLREAIDGRAGRTPGARGSAGLPRPRAARLPDGLAGRHLLARWNRMRAPLAQPG
jgi:glutathione S-transferase